MQNAFAPGSVELKLLVRGLRMTARRAQADGLSDDTALALAAALTGTMACTPATCSVVARRDAALLSLVDRVNRIQAEADGVLADAEVFMPGCARAI